MLQDAVCTRLWCGCGGEQPLMLQCDPEVHRFLCELRNRVEKAESALELLRMQHHAHKEERVLPVAVEVIFAVRLIYSRLESLKGIGG